LDIAEEVRRQVLLVGIVLMVSSMSFTSLKSGEKLCAIHRRTEVHRGALQTVIFGFFLTIRDLRVASSNLLGRWRRAIRIRSLALTGSGR